MTIGDSHTSVKDWRAIALCNVVYKVVSKVVANYLKVVMDNCILLDFSPVRHIQRKCISENKK